MFKKSILFALFSVIALQQGFSPKKTIVTTALGQKGKSVIRENPTALFTPEFIGQLRGSENDTTFIDDQAMDNEIDTFIMNEDNMAEPSLIRHG